MPQEFAEHPLDVLARQLCGGAVLGGPARSARRHDRHRPRDLQLRLAAPREAWPTRAATSTSAGRPRSRTRRSRRSCGERHVRRSWGSGPPHPVSASLVRHYGARVTPNRTGRTYDREIARLAVPALGALAAEPLYLLADTAIVGHLGTRPLAGLAVAGVGAHRRVQRVQLPRLQHHRRRRPPARRRRTARTRPRAGSTGAGSRSGSGSCSRCSASRSRPLIVDVMGASAERDALRGDVPPHQHPRRARAAARAGRRRATCAACRTRKTTLVIAVLANAVNLLHRAALRVQRSTSASRARRGAPCSRSTAPRSRTS